MAPRVHRRGIDVTGPGSGSPDGPGASGRLASNRTLARNTAFSLGGQAVTLGSAFLAVPLLLDGLGTARFGVLALAWVVIGYAQVFDLGIGRALTKLTSEAIADGRDEDVRRHFWTALVGMGTLGVLVGMIVAALSPWLVTSVLNVPAELESETLHTFWLLSASLPIAISGAALRAHLESWQRFDLVNAVVVPAALVTYFGPVVALHVENSLPVVVAAVVASRIFSWAANFLNCMRVTPELRASRRPRRESLRELLGVGGWVTAANVANALMQASDRFLIGIFASLTAVAYFATPYEVVTKLWLVSFALAGVFFPAFALTMRSDPPRAAAIFRGVLRVGFIALFPVVLLVVTFAREGLDLWLGPEFAANSDVVLQLLAVGALIGGLAQIPFGLVQSSRPDLTGKLALVELPIYLVVFVVLLETFGIEGAAAAWALRAGVEICVLLAMTARIAPGSLGGLAGLAGAGAFAVPALALGATVEGLGARIGLVAIALAAFAPFAWAYVLSTGERARIRTRLAGLRVAGPMGTARRR